MAAAATKANESCFRRGGATKDEVSPSNSPQSSLSSASCCAPRLLGAIVCGAAWAGAGVAVISSKKLKVDAVVFPGCFCCCFPGAAAFEEVPNSAKRSADIFTKLGGVDE